MINRVLCVWLCFIVTLVVSNPVPSQNTQFQNSFPHQIPTSQNGPNLQNVAVQNQALQSNLDGSINELLKNILSNPSLQKILDPNNKFYNQNGQAVKKKAKTEATPNVVNNYFIVPPEFFNVNNNQTVEKSKLKRKKKSSVKKLKHTKPRVQPNAFEDGQKTKLTQDVEQNGNKNNNSRSKKHDKNHNSTKDDKVIEEISSKNNEKEPENQLKRTKKRKKPETSKNKENKVIPTSSDINNSKSDIKQEEVASSKLNTSKRRKKAKNKQEASNDEATSTVHIPELVDIVKIDFNKNKEIESIPTGRDQTDANHLKTIESPVDDCETIENDRCIKRKKDNRKTRNPKIYKTKKESTAPLTDDILKNFYPYLFMGNNFYPNTNYPFNFDQIFKPYLQPPITDNKKNKNSKSKKTPNRPLKNNRSPSGIVKKQKNQEVATTEKPPTRANTQKFISDLKNSEASIESSKTVATNFINETDNNNINEMDNYDTENTSQITKTIELEETVPEITFPKKESVVSKANLEMPPTMIEDLYEFNSPELGGEDIVPTAHTNGIVNDYYPIFHDHSYYANDDFFSRELEDDRHFYTTDRGFEDHLYKERRKYENNGDYERNNLNIRDQTNFRRAYKYKERDKTKELDEKKQMQKDKSINEYTKNQDNLEHTTELQFQTPPILENPDFQTKRIKKIAASYDVNNNVKESGYSDFMENFSDFNIYSNVNPNEKFVNFEDSNIKKETTSTMRPINDRIETVYAKTRVIKYGIANEESDKVSPSEAVNNKNEDKFHSDAHTSYVVAKSLGRVEDYYW